MLKILIALGERALYLFEDGQIIRRYPIAIGKSSTPTPIGEYSIQHKLLNPGGSFGTRWMSFKPMYGIHGTDHQELIGKAITHGGLKMLNQDIEELFDLVSVGTPVQIVSGSL